MHSRRTLPTSTRSCGISAQHLASNPDALYLQLLGLHPRPGSIAPAATTRRYGRYGHGERVYATCAAMASARHAMERHEYLDRAWGSYASR